jgi:hypothetical protein
VFTSFNSGFDAPYVKMKGNKGDFQTMFVYGGMFLFYEKKIMIIEAVLGEALVKTNKLNICQI